GLSVMATKLELKKDMIIVIPNVEDDGEVLHTVKVDVCMVFEHDDVLCPKQPVEKPKKQHTNHDGFQHTYSSHGTNVGSKVQFTPQKPIWQAVFKMNSASSSGTKKNSEVSIKVTSSNNPFNALNTIENDDELGSNRGSSNSETKSTLPSSSKVVSKKVDDVVNEDNDNNVEEVYDEIATYMACTGFNVNKASKNGSGRGNKSLYEQ
ncbi:hypothetical protein Tco_0309466, partial [Tanacetum coccineum]